MALINHPLGKKDSETARSLLSRVLDAAYSEPAGEIPVDLASDIERFLGRVGEPESEDVSPTP